MRKIFRTLVLTTVFVLLGAASVFADDTVYTDGDYSYTVNSSGKAVITAYNGTDTDITVPATVGEYDVYSIASTFNDNDNINLVESITISEGIEIFEDGILYNTRSLKTIYLPATLNALGDSSLRYIENLENVYVADDSSWLYDVDGVLYSYNAKRKTYALLCYPASKKGDQFVVPKYVRNIYTDAFYHCKYLTKIIFPKYTNRFDSFSMVDATLNPVEIYITGEDISFGSYTFTSLPAGSKIYVPNETVANLFKTESGYPKIADTVELIDLSKLSEEELAAVTTPATDISFNNYDGKEWNVTYNYDFYGNLNTCYNVTPADTTDAITWTYCELDPVTGEPVTEPQEVSGFFGMSKPCYVRLTATTTSGKSICMNARFVKEIRDAEYNVSLTNEDEQNAVYTGEEFIPELRITYTNSDSNIPKELVRDRDYTITCENNINAGTATATITGINNYKGTLTTQYSISKARLSYNVSENGVVVEKWEDGCSITPNRKTFTYNGQEQHPTLEVKFKNKTLVEGTDYDVSYPESVEYGKYEAVVTCKGNFTGEHTVEYTIGKTDLNECQISVSDDLYSDGTYVRPYITVLDGNTTLAENTDYIVKNITYDVANEKGTLEIAASDGYYMGFTSVNYTGTVTKTFSFKYDVALDKDTYAYTGNNVTPEITVTLNGKALVKDTDYTVTYRNNTIPGTAKVTVKGKGAYEDTLDVTKEFTIAVESTEGEVYEITLGSDSYAYTGWLVYPVVTVTKNGTALVSGTDYIVNYPVAVAKGTYSLTIYGTGEYTGKFYEVKTFTITDTTVEEDDEDGTEDTTQQPSVTPPVVTPQTPTPPVVTSPSDQDNDTNSTDNTNTTKNYTPGKVSVKSVKSTSKKTMTVKWKKVSKASGYQIQYGTKSNFKKAKTVTVKSGKTTSYKIKKLFSKKKYYVRMRAYKTVNGKKYYSKWSSKKSVKIK